MEFGFAVKDALAMSTRRQLRRLRHVKFYLKCVLTLSVHRDVAPTRTDELEVKLLLSACRHFIGVGNKFCDPVANLGRFLGTA